MPKLLFFDIDNTILDEKTQTIPVEVRQALKQAKQNGHFLFINTGRTKAALNQQMTGLGMDGYVCGCGGYLEFQGKILKTTTLPLVLCEKIKHLLKACQLSGVLEGTEATYFDKDNRNPIVAEYQQRLAKDQLVISDWDQDPLHFDKLTVFLNPESDFETFYQALKEDLHFIKRGPIFYELMPHHISKASGIAYFLDYFNLSIEDAYAFGDSTNDLAMLQYVKHSIGMQNSDPEVLACVEYITDTVDHDGIRKALVHYGLI